MKISIIAALSKNGVIGDNNALPWHLPADLKNFKRLTNGHPIIMGRKTFDSIGKPLPGRMNIIISRNSSWRHVGCLSATSLDEAIHIADKENPAEIFIIGGAQIYAEAMPIADCLYLTEIDCDKKGDAFFPTFNKNEWVEKERNKQPAYPLLNNRDINFDFVVYERVKNLFVNKPPKIQ